VAVIALGAHDKVALVADRYFGELPGVTVGTSWQSRQEASVAGVHRPTVGGISGTRAEGADSIVVSGYEDDEDFGDEIIYTGAGGNDPNTGRQIADQSLEQPGNAGLFASQFVGLPVRVVRGANGDRNYSPATGYRYDGLYRVAAQEASPYVPAANLPAGTSLPVTSAGIVTRVVRNTAVCQAVKRLYHDHCQVCDTRLDVPGGSLSEGAHIRPLGRPHLGPDTPQNVLCLCPNHHTLLDEGGIYVTDDLEVEGHQGQTLGRLSRHTEHTIGIGHLRYHRELWGH
jgi:putative restriction endonuclease